MSLQRRAIEDQIEDYVKGEESKILFIWGPRRSGKTTLIKKLASKLKVQVFNFDLLSDREKFSPRREVLEKIVQKNKIILIDEVQNYPEGTVVLKILHDEFKIKIIATGSSELRQKNAVEFDSLAGRFNEIYCLPFSVLEIYQTTSEAQTYGMYPEVFDQKKSSETNKIDLLQNILDTYIIKDVIDIYELRNQKLAKDILTKIALQLGCEVSIREIAESLGAHPTTVSNYVEIFIKNYVLIPLPSFKVNSRKAVSENRKLFFYDLGIRNILVRDFRDLELRPDRGGVFENFIISEIEKARRISNSKFNMYFYREYGGKEIDLVIEDYKKNYTCVEIKVKEGLVRDIFPLPHKKVLITQVNFLSKLKYG